MQRRSEALIDFAEIVAFASGSQSTTAVSTVGLATGPVVIILIAVAIGVAASVQVFEHQAALNQLNDLRTTLTSVTNTPTDLKSLASDSTGIGLFKINNTLLTQTLPDVPSTRPLPAHRDGIDPLFFEEVYVQRPFSYRDWDENIWTAQTWGGWFVQTCHEGATGNKKCSQTDSITADLRYREPTPIHVGETIIGELDGFAVRQQLRRTPEPSSGAATTSSHAKPTNRRARALSSISRNVRVTSIRYSVTRPATGIDLFSDLQMYSAVFSRPTHLWFSAGAPSKQTITLNSTPYKSNVFVDENRRRNAEVEYGISKSSTARAPPTSTRFKSNSMGTPPPRTRTTH